MTLLLFYSCPKGIFLFFFCVLCLCFLYCLLILMCLYVLWFDIQGILDDYPYLSSSSSSPISVKDVYKRRVVFILKLFDLMKICDHNDVQQRSLWLGVSVQATFPFLQDILTALHLCDVRITSPSTKPVQQFTQNIGII